MTPKMKENSQMSYLEVTEQKHLNEARERGVQWKKWGPYLSERQSRESLSSLPTEFPCNSSSSVSPVPVSAQRKPSMLP